MSQHSLEDVSIDGFRGLRNLSLEGLGRLNLLVGENNSGKTSVLEALSILCNPMDPYEWLAMVRRRDFGGLDETRIQSLRWSFLQTGELVDPELMFRGFCEMKRSGAFPLQMLSVDYVDFIGEPNSKELERIARRRRKTAPPLEMDEPYRGAEITHSVVTNPSTSHERIAVQFWEDEQVMGSPYRPTREGSLPTETLTPYSYQLNRLQTRSFSNRLFASNADPTKGRGNILELINQFDPDIVDIEIASLRGVRPALYLNHKRMGPAPLSVFGDALRRAVLLASTLHKLKGGGVLLIDEIETGIHICALERVFKWLAQAAKQFKVQVIATTHSLEAVDAIAESMADGIDELVTFHLNQTDRDTLVKRIPGELLQRLRRERGLDVR